MTILTPILLATHPVWLLVCRVLPFLGLEAQLGSTTLFAACGDWSGMETLIRLGAGGSNASAPPRALGEVNASAPPRALGDWGYFTVASGPCSVGGGPDRGCVYSPGWPNQYPDNVDCVIAIDLYYDDNQAGLDLRAFNTEYNHDELELDFDSISGECSGMVVPVPASRQINWEPDFSNARDGWEICLGPLYPSSDSPVGCRYSDGSWAGKSIVRELLTYEEVRRRQRGQRARNQRDLQWILLLLVVPSIILFVTWAVIVRIYNPSVQLPRASTAAMLQPAAIQASQYNMRNSGNDFKYRLCHCFDDGWTLLHALCCTVPRIGDTHNAIFNSGVWCFFTLCMSGFLVGTGFDIGYVIYTGNQVTPNFRYFMMNLLIAFYCGGKRAEIRTRFEGNNNGAWTCLSFSAWNEMWCMDFLVWFCCMHCAATQEARQIDGAAGLKMQGCCGLVPMTGMVMGVPQGGMPAAVMVGAPVGVVPDQPVQGQAMQDLAVPMVAVEIPMEIEDARK